VPQSDHLQRLDKGAEKTQFFAGGELSLGYGSAGKTEHS